MQIEFISNETLGLIEKCFDGKTYCLDSQKIIGRFGPIDAFIFCGARNKKLGDRGELYQVYDEMEYSRLSNQVKQIGFKEARELLKKGYRILKVDEPSESELEESTQAGGRE